MCPSGAQKKISLLWEVVLSLHAFATTNKRTTGFNSVQQHHRCRRHGVHRARHLGVASMRRRQQLQKQPRWTPLLASSACSQLVVAILPRLCLLFIQHGGSVRTPWMLQVCLSHKPRGWDAHTRRSPSSPPSLALLPNSTARSQSSSTHDHPPRSSAYLIHDLCFTWYCMMCYGSIGICLQPPSDLDIEWVSGMRKWRWRWSLEA